MCAADVDVSGVADTAGETDVAALLEACADADTVGVSGAVGLAVGEALDAKVELTLALPDGDNAAVPVAHTVVHALRNAEALRLADEASVLLAVEQPLGVSTGVQLAVPVALTLDDAHLLRSGVPLLLPDGDTLKVVVPVGDAVSKALEETPPEGVVDALSLNVVHAVALMELRPLAVAAAVSDSETDALAQAEAAVVGESDELAHADADGDMLPGALPLRAAVSECRREGEPVCDAAALAEENNDAVALALNDPVPDPEAVTSAEPLASDDRDCSVEGEADCDAVAETEPDRLAGALALGLALAEPDADANNDADEGIDGVAQGLGLNDAAVDSVLGGEGVEDELKAVDADATLEMLANLVAETVAEAAADADDTKLAVGQPLGTAEALVDEESDAPDDADRDGVPVRLGDADPVMVPQPLGVALGRRDSDGELLADGESDARDALCALDALTDEDGDLLKRDDRDAREDGESELLPLGERVVDVEGVAGRDPEGDKEKDAEEELHFDALGLRDAKVAVGAAEAVPEAEERAVPDTLPTMVGVTDSDTAAVEEPLAVAGADGGADAEAVTGAVASAEGDSDGIRLTESSLLTVDALDAVAADDADSDVSELPLERSENVAVATADDSALVLPDETREAVAAFESVVCKDPLGIDDTLGDKLPLELALDDDTTV